MNTIQITNANGVTVNYTENEIINIIQARESYRQTAEQRTETLHNIKHKVRDFFSEGQWDDNEFSASKEDINELLESCGINKLTTKYKGTYTITGTFNVEVEDEYNVEDLFKDNVTVEFNDGDVDVDEIEVMDIETDD